MPERQRLLELALKGLQSDRAKLDDEIAEVQRELGNRPAVAKIAAVPTSSAKATAPRKKRKMSAEARRKISETMKRRYAEMRRTKK